MAHFSNLIKREMEVMNRLQDDVHTTFLNRNKDRDSWSKACEKFHSYISPIDQEIDKIYETSELKDPETLEFVITFLELDPMFFRSGYIKEDMIQKLKRQELTQEQLNRVTLILIDAARNRGQREFKSYCRLAKVVSSDLLVKSLKSIIELQNGACKSRSKLMLGYIST